MTPRSRRLISLVLIGIVAAACTSSTNTTTTTAGPASTVTTGAPGTTDAGEGTTTSAPEITRPDLSGLEGLSVGVREQLEDVIVTAQEIRQLPLLEVPQITVLDEAAFQARVQALIADAADSFPADEALYQTLGLLAADANLESMLTSLYSEQVAGFYDEGEIVVPAQDESLSIVAQGSILHEMVHALTDQHFGFDAIRVQLEEEERFDELSSYQALAEGDASLAELLWVQTLSQREIGEFIAASLEVDTSIYDSMPRFIRDSLIFPYQSGLEFVQGLHQVGGWEAVNDAYLEMPELPGSTEQILTPGDYGRDLPVPVEVIDVAVPGYELEVTSVWGELGLRLMLDQGLGENASLDAADGWGGDFYHQWFDGENAALLVVFTADTAADLEELRTGLLAYALAMIDDEDFAWVDEEEGLLYFIVADEELVGEGIRDAAGLTA
jgi:hypothetical protein